jgi:hypothetical protein
LQGELKRGARQFVVSVKCARVLGGHRQSQLIRRPVDRLHGKNDTMTSLPANPYACPVHNTTAL